jgi:hypothetical protein
MTVEFKKKTDRSKPKKNKEISEKQASGTPADDELVAI